MVFYSPAKLKTFQRFLKMWKGHLVLWDTLTFHTLLKIIVLHAVISSVKLQYSSLILEIEFNTALSIIQFPGSAHLSPYSI